MTKLYAIFSRRGMWIEELKATKRRASMKHATLTLIGKEHAERIAKRLSAKHKQKYWVEEVEVIVAPKD
jgi:hypothetical protein